MANRSEIPVQSNAPEMAAHNNIINSHNHNPYVKVMPPPTSPANNKTPNPMNTIFGAVNRCGKTVKKATKQAENIADKFWKHTMARVVQGTKVLMTYGGHDGVFENTFGRLQGDKLLNQYACYISTSNGPILGTFYISTKRLAFCSDYPFYYYPNAPHNSRSVYYKVVIPMEQLSRASPCTTSWNPAEKYIEIVTVDGYEFTFMGFIAYDKALKTLNEALQRHRNHSSAT
ncbi:GEM-like protein 1 isoform X2 [Neltuma alba]|uniref:GEM-like protein 1 isoform X2 n=1 Tax=Neltuma alba TaxID=207710 RepID=UPI0010A5017A|nr:GEM-like protein 1 isoform X2 [Prosopis alba]